MRLNIPSLVVTLALATSVSADWLEVYKFCVWSVCDAVHSKFITANGRYDVNANNGCRGTSVPSMSEFCVDTKNNRAHFKFSFQNGLKHCLRKVSETSPECNGSGVGQVCSYSENWQPTPCTW